MQQVKDITSNRLQDELFQQDTPILVEFGAGWCPPCRALEPILEKVSQQRKDIDIIKIDVDEEQEFSSTQKIQSIPTMIIYKEGHEQARLIGAHPEHRIHSFIDNYIS